MRVLRLCSVFESPSRALEGRGRAFDPVGGLQNHAAELTRMLDRRGVTQTVVTATRPGAPPFERLGERSCLVRVGVPVRRLRQLYSVPAFFLAQAFAARADLVHVHLGEDLAVLPIGPLAAARLHRLPLVLTVHSSFRHTLPALNGRTALLKAVGGAVERWGERRADAVLVLTVRLARLLAEEGVDERSIFVVPSGVNGSLFTACEDDLFPELGRPRVLFVGRLVPQKDAERLLLATPLLANESARVLLVGDGPERRTLEARAQALRLGDRVHLAGFVPHEQIPRVLAHADVLVLPSVYEELGSVLLEAMWAGVPVVASRTGGIPEAVADGVNGLLVPPRDPHALAAAIDRVLSDRALAERLSAGARERATQYDWEPLADRVLEIYSCVAQGRRRARR